MKKILSFAVLALLSASVLMGCKKKEEVVVVPPAGTNMPSTNAPAAP
ncbi:MAG: hypothetical protein M3Y82_05060 [Verrucomicrobiota bacterium]|nr:hypothetical protein [Verrucomicrobiota bacterium]